MWKPHADFRPSICRLLGCHQKPQSRKTWRNMSSKPDFPGNRISHTLFTGVIEFILSFFTFLERFGAKLGTGDLHVKLLIITGFTKTDTVKAMLYFRVCMMFCLILYILRPLLAEFDCEISKNLLSDG